MAVASRYTAFRTWNAAPKPVDARAKARREQHG
jgi:hypothetical protein